jgi:hypothetical protein
LKFEKNRYFSLKKIVLPLFANPRYATGFQGGKKKGCVPTWRFRIENFPGEN